MSGAVGAAAASMQQPQESPTYTQAHVLCCICGAVTPPHPRNKCLSCLQEELDVSSQVCRNFVVDHCRQCSRFKDAQGKWLPCQLESRELLALCLKKIRGLKSLSRIVDCRWLFTEPHSNKLLLRITARADVLEGKAQVEQSFNVQGIIHNMQCDDCKRAFTPHAGWGARVQVRQRCEHKRTFLFLEQLVLQQHQLLEKLLRAVQKKDGLDFHFPNKQAAAAFVAFCSSRFPCSSRSSKQLISHDCNSNTYFYKHTVYVELAPICKDDLVFIPAKKTKESFGGFPSLSICSRVGCTIQLVDAFTAKQLELSAEVYFRDSFLPLCTRKHLSYFLILSLTPLPHHEQSQQRSSKRQKHQHIKDQQLHAATNEDMAVDLTENEAASRSSSSNSSSSSSKGFLLAEAELLRCSAKGVPEGEPIFTRTHLGHVLQSGDFAAGFDLQRINLSGFADTCLERDVHWPQGGSGTINNSTGKQQQQGLAAAPWEVMLVKKHYPFRKAARRRQWVLRTLQKHQDDDGERIEEDEAANSNHLGRGNDDRKRRGGAGRRGGGCTAEDEDFEEFKRDIEEDADLRKQVALYRDPRAFNKHATGAAKIRIGTKKPQQQQQQQQQLQKRREANKARKLAEAQERKQQREKPDGAEASDWDTEKEGEGDDEADDAPVVNLSELLEGLSIEDLKPVAPGQGITADDSQAAGQQASSDEEDTL